MEDKIRVDMVSAFSRYDLYKRIEEKLKEINEYSFFRFKEAHIVGENDSWAAFIFYWVLPHKKDK